MTRASFTSSDLSSVFAQIGKATAGPEYQGWTGERPASSNAVELNAASAGSAQKVSAEQAALDSDMYDQWANGLIGDDEWLAYIAKRVAATTGNAKEHEKWVKYQRKYATDISDHQMKYRYEQGEITLDDYISYQRKTLAGLDSDSQEWRERNSALTAMVEQRSATDIGLRSQNTLADINEGKATYDDLIAVYQDGLRSAKPGTDWYMKLESAIADARDKKRTSAFNGSAEQIQYLFEAGKLTGRAAGAQLRSLADQYLKGDQQNYYKTLQAALDYEKYGGATGASGGGGGSGGVRRASRTTIGDAYLARSSTAYNKLAKALETPGESISYLQKLARDAINEAATSSKFLAANGTKDQVKAMQRRRDAILAEMEKRNTINVQTRLDGVLRLGMVAVEEAARNPAADGGDGAIKELTKLFNQLDGIIKSLPTDEAGQVKQTFLAQSPDERGVVPREELPAPGPETLSNSAWLTELYGVHGAIGNILNMVNGPMDLTDEDVATLVRMGDLTRFDLTDGQAKWSVLPVKEEWADFLEMSAKAAQDLHGVHSGSRVNIRLRGGSPATLPIETVTGSISVGPGGTESQGSSTVNQADPAKAGVADGNILVPMLEMGANGQANMVYVEAEPLTIRGNGGIDIGSVQANVAFTHPTLKGSDGKPLKIEKGQFLTAEQWNSIPEADRRKMGVLGQVAEQAEVPVYGYYRFYGTDQSAYLYNNQTGKTLLVGRKGAERLPFDYTDTVGGMSETGTVNAVENPILATYVPIARTGEVTDSAAQAWLNAKNVEGDEINGGVKLGLPIIDGTTGRSSFIPRDDVDGRGQRISEFFGRAMEIQNRRPGENAYLTPQQRLEESRRLTGVPTPAEATAGPRIEPWAGPSVVPLANQYGIRGFGGYSDYIALAQTPRTAPTPPQQADASSQMREWALSHATKSGPALTGRQDTTSTPRVTARPSIGGADPRENEDFITPPTVTVGLPSTGASKITVPVGATRGRRTTTATPPPAAPRPPKTQKPKPRRTTASGQAVGGTRVAS